MEVWNLEYCYADVENNSVGECDDDVEGDGGDDDGVEGGELNEKNVGNVPVLMMRMWTKTLTGSLTRLEVVGGVDGGDDDPPSCCYCLKQQW